MPTRRLRLAAGDRALSGVSRQAQAVVAVRVRGRVRGRVREGAAALAQASAAVQAQAVGGLLARQAEAPQDQA